LEISIIGLSLSGMDEPKSKERGWFYIFVTCLKNLYMCHVLHYTAITWKMNPELEGLD